MGAYKLLTDEKSYLSMLKEKFKREVQEQMGRMTKEPGGFGTISRGSYSGPLPRTTKPAPGPLPKTEEDEITPNEDEKLLIDKPVVDKEEDEKEVEEQMMGPRGSVEDKISARQFGGGSPPPLSISQRKAEFEKWRKSPAAQTSGPRPIGPSIFK